MTVKARISDFVIPGDHGPNQRETWVVIPNPKEFPDSLTYFVKVMKRDGSDIPIGLHFSGPDTQASYPPSEQEEILIEREVDGAWWASANYVALLISNRRRIQARLKRDTFLSSREEALALVQYAPERTLTEDVAALVSQFNAALPEDHQGKAIHFLD